MIYAALVIIGAVASAFAYRTGYKRATEYADNDFRLIPKDVWPEEDVVLLVNLSQQSVVYPMEIGHPRRVLVVTGQDPPCVIDIVSDGFHPEEDPRSMN